MDHWSGLFEPAYECDEIIAEFEWPFWNERFYIAGDTAPAGTEIPIRVHAYRWETILRDTGGIEHLPSVPDIMLEFTEWPLEEVRFYVNGAPVGTVAFTSTRKWTKWKTVDAIVTFKNGGNIVRLTALDEGPNLDALAVNAAQ